MTKSQFMGSAEHMRDKLGHAMCLAKWQQVSLHLPTGLNNSCYHPPLHEIDAAAVTADPSALHNTEHKKQQRKIMLRQERPSECSYCWNMEDLGNLSDRHYRSGEPWAAQHADSIMSSSGDENVIPSYVEVNFSHGCNLSCSYCSPQFSSTWAAEVDKFGGFPTVPVHNDPSHFQGRNRPIPVREENPYVEAFWNWWPELYPRLKHFRMTGGEPLMDRNTYRVFDYILNTLPNTDLHVDVTSNFSVEPALFDKYLGYVKQLCVPDPVRIEHFMQYVSVDSGIPAHAEYIRHGLNFDRLRKNANRFLEEIPGRNSMTFIVTLNNLSVLGLKDLLVFILTMRSRHSDTYQRVWFDTPVLRQPAWQSLQILPESYACRLDDIADWMETRIMEPGSFVGFKDYEVQRLRRAIDWMRQGQNMPQSRLETDRANFFRFFSHHDHRRGTVFSTTFNQMNEFWKECSYHARNQ